jgi:hypothetical protein
VGENGQRLAHHPRPLGLGSAAVILSEAKDNQLPDGSADTVRWRLRIML